MVQHVNQRFLMINVLLGNKFLPRCSQYLYDEKYKYGVSAGTADALHTASNYHFYFHENFA